MPAQKHSVTTSTYIIVLIELIFFLFFFAEKTLAITYYPPGSPGNPSSAAFCQDDGGSFCTKADNLDDCTNYGEQTKDNVCFQVPWTFKYAASCQVCLGDRPGSCAFSYEYQYNECNTEDRCWGSSTGASGFDSAGRIWPGICSARSFDGSNPNTACISGGHYKQCCSNPEPGYTPATYCSNGICPAGWKTAALDTDCDTPSVPTATTAPLR